MKKADNRRTSETKYGFERNHVKIIQAFVSKAQKKKVANFNRFHFSVYFLDSTKTAF